MVVQINVAIYDSANAERRCNKLRLKAGQLLLQLRQRIEAGEEGDVSWWWPLMQRLKSSTKRMHGRGKLIDAAAYAARAWAELLTTLQKKPASTLPQDGLSEVAVDNPTPEKK